MRIEEVFLNLNIDDSVKKISFKSISEDTRDISKGDLFFIIKRDNFDIFSILNDIECKVSAFVADIKYKNNLKGYIKSKPVIFVKNIKEEFHRVVDFVYGFNKKDLMFIGITGTNGKSTTATMIYYILKSIGEKASLFSTVKNVIGDSVQKADFTTPGYLSIRKMLSKINDKERHYVVMEVSSHGIVQQRIKNINFLRCIFTNLSRDHLDYHKNMENYFKVKKQLFINNKKGISLINIDDRYGRKIFKELDGSISYGMNLNADYRAVDITLSNQGSKFRLESLGKSFNVKTRLCGKYNVFNCLAAVSTVISLGYSITKVLDAVSSFNPVEGRLEAILNDVFVDYAHTPDGLEKVLKTLWEVGYRKIICLLGCGGNRDKGKRKIMGEVASLFADFSIITSDNPRNEDPLDICLQIESGFTTNNYKILLDREQAIEKALKMFFNFKGQYLDTNKGKKVCLVVTGKGHEEYQLISNTKYPFKDADVIRKIIKKIKCKGA